VSSSSVAIAEVITFLRSLSQLSVQADWHYGEGDRTIDEVAKANWRDWTIAEQNARNHLAWAKGRKVCWFIQQIRVPQHLQGFPLQGLCLRLALTWWAEQAQIFVNGVLVQEGDLFDCSTRLLLSSAVTPGDEFVVALRLVSPGHDDGALVRSLCIYESPAIDDAPEPGFVADELEVLHLYLKTFAPEQIGVLEAAIADLNGSHQPHSPTFTQTLAQLRDRLLPLSALLKQRTIKLLGHAHLDMAWLWTVEETWKAAERTFESVLKLQDEFPELIFCHSTPALYEWMEHNRPDLFRRIQEQVKAGRWEPIGGIWVEPELNIISAESIARQILYGQRYYQEKFGKTSAIAWLPDTFGFNWQLPQFLKQGGIDYFVTQKLRWNDTTQFPYELFNWQAPNGAQILSLMSAPIGEGIDPVKMATYSCDWEQKTGIPFCLWLPGVGDHGGGPTRDMLELARRWGRSPFFPKLEFTTAEGYFRELETGGRTAEARRRGEGGSVSKGGELSDSGSELSTLNFQSPVPLPIWNSELYLEFHRGCYTTHGDQKWWNRRCEQWLYWAELCAALATIVAGTPYPKAEIEAAWKRVLFNQFHDILPGSSIQAVYPTANQGWASVAKTTGMWEESLQAIAAQIALPSPPHPDARAIIVFNPCSWERSSIVYTTLSEKAVDGATLTGFEESRWADFYWWQLRDLDGQEVEAPFCIFSPSSGNYSWGITFLAENIPALGYRCFWLCPQSEPTVGEAARVKHVLENRFLRVEVNPDTGDLFRVFDKVNQREVLSGAGNHLQAFRDEGQYWDAWNIDPNYEEHPLPPAELLSIDAMSGADRNSSLVENIRVKRRIGRSVLNQTYVLERESSILKIDTSVDWQERHVLVKAAFPLNLEADYATYEIPGGTIQRTTKPQSDREKAQWEVPAMQWADLSDGIYGVSLLNDSKYGYDCKPNQIRLTLLRGSEWPNPEADRGKHSFTYALYPHAGTWQAAQTVRHGYELNMPLLCTVIPNQRSPKGILPPQGQFLDLGVKNLVLTAFKQSEHSPNHWILRCYECHGEQTEITFRSDLGLKLQHRVDLLEIPLGSQNSPNQTDAIQPWQVASFAIAVDQLQAATPGQPQFQLEG
jgi:alpha-mannosidase